jgi:hypothetical protein
MTPGGDGEVRARPLWVRAAPNFVRASTSPFARLAQGRTLVDVIETIKRSVLILTVLFGGALSSQLAHADEKTAAKHVDVLLLRADADVPVDLRALIAEAQRAPAAPTLRLDGALFEGLATAGLVVAAQSDHDAPAPRPVAGLSPRLLRGGGVACDVRLAF